METTFLQAAKGRNKTARALLTGSLVLCGLTSLGSTPALADSATFGGLVSATVTVPTAPGITYAANADPNPYVFTFLQGNAAANAGNPGFFSWTNGTLAFSPGMVTGWAASQWGNDSNYSFVTQQSTPTLDFINTNNYGVDIPISASLTYAQNITCSSCGEYSMNGASSSAWLYINSVGPTSYDDLGTAGLNCFLGAFGPPWNGACQAGSGAPRSSTFPVSGNFTETLDYWVPADSSATISVELQSEYQANVATPEPATWALLGMGLLGFAGVARLRLRRI